MSTGISPRIPLVVSEVFGAYDLITNFEDLARQNLKMVIMTNPGERMMDINFGVGIRKYIFEPNKPSTYSEIRSRIAKQVGDYLPYIKIEKIDFLVPEGNPDLFPNTIMVNIHFSMPGLSSISVLQIDVRR